ncbi:MAG: hypothetical protein BWX91_01064 [Spirochaetes bacterium ADurb.Bin133]|jgi:hypothetical protein|nr:MAG: hypothetical protein BWX91_01064 [Spirochaetes bacterium ADurb.Bin133]
MIDVAIFCIPLVFWGERKYLFHMCQFIFGIICVILFPIPKNRNYLENSLLNINRK